VDPKNAAMHRLLTDAQQGGQAKVDALIALSQRTVWVVSWPSPEDGYRTLVNSGGMAALPVFTERELVESAAERFGWVGADGVVAASEVGARQALTFARDRGLAFVVVDIVADHSLEIARAELEPLLTPAARRESQGAFSGTGRISTALMQSVQSVRPTPAPMAAVGPIRAPTPPPGALSPARPNVAPPPGSSPGSVRAEPASSPGAIVAAMDGPPSPLVSTKRLAPLTSSPDLPLVDRLDGVLRDYPEVEWACIGLVSSGQPVIGLRVDPRMRTRIEPLLAELGRVSGGMPVTLLDDPAVMRTARIEAYVFFPWRKKVTGTF
jgi:hypothetical protein